MLQADFKHILAAGISPGPGDYFVYGLADMPAGRPAQLAAGLRGIELEEMRAEHAKKLAGLSIDEQLRMLKQEAEAAHRELGLKLPQAQLSKHAA